MGDVPRRSAGRGAAVARRGLGWGKIQTALGLMGALGSVSVWLISAVAGPVDGAGVTVDIISDPPLEQIVPGRDLVRLTLAAAWQGKPIEHGQLSLRLLAPQRSAGLLPASPPVEGTELLRLTSTLQQGAFQLAYRFPLSGIYRIELELSPLSGEEDFPPTALHQDLQVYDDPWSGQWRWLLAAGPLALGAFLGLKLGRRLTARTQSSAVIGLVALLGLWQAGTMVSPGLVGADHPMPAVREFPRGPQVIRGNEGWELTVRPTPVQARVGEMLQLTILLNKDGSIFPQPTEVALNVYQLRDDKPILRTQLVAPMGFSSQHLQLFDSAPHTCTVTARPAATTGAESVGLTAVLGMDVAAASPSPAVILRLLAVWGGMLGGGLAAGFLVAQIGKETGHA